MTKFVKLWRNKSDSFDFISGEAEVIGMLVPVATLVEYVGKYEPNKTVNEFIENYSVADSYELLLYMERNVVEL